MIMATQEEDVWYAAWNEELDRPRNGLVALRGQATLRQAINFLRDPDRPGSVLWHLVVARTNRTWAARRFVDLYGLAQVNDVAKLDALLDDLDWLYPATVVDVDEIAPEDALREAREQPGQLVVVLQGDELAGIVFAGVERGEAGSTSELIALAGRPADLSRFGELRIKRRRPRKR
jgi:hypothetical protein